MIAKNFKFFVIAPAVIIIAAVIAGIIFGGFNLGLDFTGGTLITVDMGTTFDSEEVREVVSGMEQVTGDVSVVTAGSDGTEALIRIQHSTDNAIDDEFAADMVAKLAETWTKAKTSNIESVGATASGTLVLNAFLAVAIACVLMLIYITIRFQLHSAVGAVVALVHDVIIMCAVMCIFRVSVDSTFIAACLTIVGYSINATVIIFDRLRDNLRKYSLKQHSLENIVDISVKESIGRTINTTITTLIMIVALYILGVNSIKIFAFPIIIGIIAGTYSSMIIAPGIWLLMAKKFGVKKPGVKAIS